MNTAAGLGDELLEREGEVARLQTLIDAAAAGEGRVVLVEGDAGIGKSAILRKARGLAGAAGLTVLLARGGELERGFAHGVARQLYEPPLNAARARARRALLRGAARLARPVLGQAAAARPPSLVGDPAFAANHGLYWLTANLAQQQPLLLLVDDAHWADSATLVFLNYLGRRLEGLPVLVALGLRPAELGVPRELLDTLGELPSAETLRPASLTEQASGALIERLLCRPVHEAFRGACHEVTGGNPFLLEELARALLADAVEPTEQSAGRVRRLGPRSIARSVLGRLGAMWPDALALARAVSVLDTDADLRHAAPLAELGVRAAQDAADALTAAHILAPGRPLRFAHPIMRQAVYEDLPHARRAADHARAARLLDSEGADPDRAAVHLLAAEPVGDAWALDKLRAAARRALARGAPEAAAGLMRRALAEPPARSAWAATLLELGRAERLAGESDAVTHLRQALEEATGPGFYIEAARELATALATSARPDDAVQLLEDVIARAPDREAALLLEAQLFGLSQASDALAARIGPRLDRVCRGMVGNTPGERLTLAASVFHRTFLGRASGDEVAALARRALGQGQLLREATGDQFAFYGPLIALRDSDHHDELRPLFDEAIADARARGSAVAGALTLGTLARLEHVQGNLAQAAAAGRSAIELAASSTQYRLALPLAASALIPALVERGRLQEADNVLATYELEVGPPPATTTGNPFLAARAKLRLAQGRVQDAVDDTNVWLARQRLRGGLNAVGASSILNPALAFLAAGDRRTAEALAEEMVVVAKHWRVAGFTGTSLLALGLVTGGERGIQLLRQAVALLERSPRRLELAHALVELGSALRRANKRADARVALRAGSELAHRCGAEPLAELARQELRAMGDRPRRPVFSGLESLTAQERRVAELAAQGLSNPRIAQTLFVTRRTIETHLGHVYQKLEVRSREQLAAALHKPVATTASAASPASAHALRDG